MPLLSLSTGLIVLGLAYLAYRLVRGPFRAFSVLMFLTYFVWGSWYVTMGTYLGTALKFSDPEIGAAYSMLSVAAMISPFFVGRIADRFFATQKVLGTLHLAGAGLLLAIPQARDPAWVTGLVLAYTLCFMPAVALGNAICFRQMPDPGQAFPPVRVLGTIGWIVAGGLLSLLGIEARAEQFWLAAAVSLATGVFCFFLPDTPPRPAAGPAGLRALLGLDALHLLRRPPVAVLVAASVAVCIPLAFYYGFANPFLNETGLAGAAAKMTLGQASELGFLLAMPLLLARWGVKYVMLLGMAAWVGRYLLFAYGGAGASEWMLYGGIVLHGICYDFFFVTGQLYLDRQAPEHLKGAAQGLVTFATYGLGMFAGSLVSGQVVGAHTLGAGAHDWRAIWLVPAAASAVVLVAFAVLFREESPRPAGTPVAHG